MWFRVILQDRVQFLRVFRVFRVSTSLGLSWMTKYALTETRILSVTKQIILLLPQQTFAANI